MKLRALIVMLLAAALMTLAVMPSLAQARPKGDDRVLRLDLEELGLGDLERKQQAAERGRRELRTLRADLAQARRTLPLLRRQANSATRTARRAERVYRQRRTRSARLTERLNELTLNYINMAGATAFSEATQHAEVADLAQIAAEDADVQDAVLVHAQGQMLMDQLSGQLDEIRQLSDAAEQARKEAFSAKQAAQASRTAARQAVRDQRRLTAVLSRDERHVRSRLTRDQQQLGELLERLLAAEDAMPELDVSPELEGLPAGQRIALLARREFDRGVVEEPLGSNDSPDIARYRTATVGAAAGQPWCAYFVSYIARRAGVPIGNEGRGEGYVPYVRAWATKQQRFFSGARNRPQPGDLVLWPQHIGIVAAVRGETLITIEGNSSDRVARNERDIASVSGFVRLGGQLDDPDDRANSDAQTPDDTL